MPCQPLWPVYVLAGGKSRRFGSDKARALLDGKPLLVTVIEALRPVSSGAYVVAASAGAYDDLGVPTIGDEHPGTGPLAGLHAALAHATTRDSEWVLLASCDLIRPDAQAVSRLAPTIQPGHHAAVYESQGWLEPFPGLYHVELLPRVCEALRSGDRSMQSLLRSLGPGLVVSHAPDGGCMAKDADTPDALRRSQKP